MSLFVDTSIWFAISDRSDPANARAKEILSSSREPLVTTDHVVVETWTLLHHRIGRRVAELFWERLHSGVVNVEFVGPADLEAAWQIGRSWPDQDFSIVDRTSFAIMLRLGIDRVASLDQHFAIFRFGPRRRLSLTVLR